MRKLKSPYILVILSTLFLWSCSRPNNDTSKLSLRLPERPTMSSKVSASATSTVLLGHLIINVSGPGIDVPITFNYDANKQDGTTPTAVPTSQIIEIPSGNSRLIQVLAVYVDTSTKMGEFFYGEILKDVNSSNVSADITIKSVGVGDVEGGRVAGRYINADGSSPSGDLELRYRTPNGLSMVIERSTIMSGWFSVMALDTVPFDIVLRGKELHLFDALTLNSMTFTDNKKVKIQVPDYYQSFGGTSGSNRKGFSGILGFFGPGVSSSNRVCLTQGSYTFTNLYKDSTKTAPLSWAMSSTSNYDVRPFMHSTVGLCVSGDENLAYNSVLPFEPSLINNWGGPEAISGFYNVFQFPLNSTNGSAPVRVSFNSTSGQFNSEFSILPGMESLMDSIAIFYRDTNSPRNFESSGQVRCSDIADLSKNLGFINSGQIPIVAGQTNYSILLPSPAGINSNAVMVYCPMKANSILGGGFANSFLFDIASSQQGGGNTGGGVISPGVGGNTGGGTTSVDPNNFNSYLFFSEVGFNQCHSVQISLYQNVNGTQNWNNVVNSTQRDFSITSTQVTNYSTESDCLLSQNSISSVSVLANENSTNFWVRSSSTPGAGTITLTTTSFGTSLSNNINFNVVTTSIATQLRSNTDRMKLFSNLCQTVDIYSVDSFNRPVASNFPINLNLSKTDLNSTIVTDSSFEFYADCSLNSTPVSTLTIAANKFKTTLAIKTNSGVVADRRARIEATTPLSSLININLNIIAQADHLSVLYDNSTPIYEGTCVPLTVRAETVTNTLADTTNFNFNLDIYHPSIMQNFGQIRHNCNAPPTGPMSFNLVSGLLSGIYFLPTNAGSGVILQGQSLFVDQMRQTNLTINYVPPAHRPSSLKVHFTSDTLQPNLTSVSSWPVPQFIDLFSQGKYPSSISNSTLASTSANLAVDGVVMSTGSTFGGLLTNFQGSDEFAITVRFKMTALTAADILTLKNGSGTGYDARIYVEYNSGFNTYELKGTGGWVHNTPIAVNTWYTVTLTRSNTDVYGYVNDTNSGVGNSFPVSASNFTDFVVGGGFNGSIKAVIIDSAPVPGNGAPPNVYGTIGKSDHAYLSTRVPAL